MLRLLSKLKEDLAHNGVEVVNSTLQGDTIKLMCSANGRRDTELNAYIIPDGDGFNFYTQAPSEGKSDEIKLTEEQIVPTIISKVDPNKPYVVENQETTETTEDLQDEIKIEVEDGVFDTKVVKHNSYNNSRYAYSSKYGKMGTIVEIRTINARVPKPNKSELKELFNDDDTALDLAKTALFRSAKADINNPSAKVSEARKILEKMLERDKEHNFGAMSTSTQTAISGLDKYAKWVENKVKNSNK